MGQSLKAIVQLLLILAAIAAFLVWVLPDRPDATTWAFRLALTLIALALAIVLVRNARRKEVFPDLLAEECGTYFERDGFCFAFVPIAIQGISWMQVFFHNRYERPCIGRVVLQPPREYFLGKQAPLAGIDVDIDCDSGAFGVCRIPWPIPARLQGKKTKFEVAGAVQYPAGRGKLLRYREGARVGAPSGGMARAAATGGLLLIGRPLRLKFRKHQVHIAARGQ